MRAALKESIALEIKLKGQPITRLVFLADGYEEVLDLTTAVRDDCPIHRGLRPPPIPLPPAQDPRLDPPRGSNPVRGG